MGSDPGLGGSGCMVSPSYVAVVAAGADDDAGTRPLAWERCTRLLAQQKK